MIRVLEGAHVPIRIWSRRVHDQHDDRALAQLRRVAALPFVVEAVCAMPDVHVANGVAVGTVFATEDVVVPGALGGDLGCGIAAARVPGAAIGLDRPTLERVVDALASLVPVGDATHRRPRSLPDTVAGARLSTRALAHARDGIASRHLGTLGGGNHFLELDRDVDGDLWILVHSGSRGFGAAIAEHHRRVAGHPLAGLPLDGAGRAYLDDLAVALAFAAENRAAILERAIEVVRGATGNDADADRIDVHHNHVAREVHGGRALLVHRKGAIAAPSGARAIVPGSMGTASYVVEGRGEPASFASASHGAGRVASRGEAHRSIPRARAERSMRGVVHRVAGSLVEECPDAYRDIVEVLEDERDLIEPLLRIEPIAVLKG